MLWCASLEGRRGCRLQLIATRKVHRELTPVHACSLPAPVLLVGSAHAAHAEAERWLLSSHPCVTTAQL